MKIFVPFAAIEAYRHPTDEMSFYFGAFAYDNISDEAIEESLTSGRAQMVDLNRAWEGQIKGQRDHATRIGALVLVQSRQGELAPVSMEISEHNRNLNLVVDGHHRIRALQFMRLAGFWAELGGDTRLIKEFVGVCRQHQP